MKYHVPTVALVVLLLLVLWPQAATAEKARALSPGLLDQVDVVESGCPLFSWVPDSESEILELLIYRLPEGVAPEEFEASEDLMFSRIVLPGKASSWTPSLEQRLDGGRRYAWVIRGIDAKTQSAPPRFLSVLPLSLPEAVPVRREAARLIRASGRTHHPSPRRESPPPAAEIRGKSSSKNLLISMAPAAIRAENPVPTSSENYGLAGESPAQDGAGIAAMNLNGGPDLLLDGSVEGYADARLWEWGMERNSNTDTGFAFRNPGAGSFSLDVEGEISADELDCPFCIGSEELQDEAAGASEIAEDAVTNSRLSLACVLESDLANSAVGNVALADHAVTAMKLGASSVSGAAIADGTIDHDKISTLGGVFSSKDALYERSAIGYLHNETGTLSVLCNDVNDLPLQGSCKVEDPEKMRLISRSASHWNSTTEAAAFSCKASESGLGSWSYEAFIICIEVTGP